MGQQITLWKDSRLKNDPQDYDEIETFHIKSVGEITNILQNVPRRCTMISREYSGPHRNRKGEVKRDNERRFTILWEKNDPSNLYYKRYWQGTL